MRFPRKTPGNIGFIAGCGCLDRGFPCAGLEPQVGRPLAHDVLRRVGFPPYPRSFLPRSIAPDRTEGLARLDMRGDDRPLREPARPWLRAAPGLAVRSVL